jgi:pyridoxal phosphate enzyme (YggS family)
LPIVRERIGQALQRAGRSDEVRLVAVTKGHAAAAVQAAQAVGLTDCGENRVAELADKVAEIGRHAATWHLIGHLQRNKARKAVELFDYIHSIDSVRLAKELSAEACRAGIQVRGLIEVNASGEASKSGFDVANDESAVRAAVQEISELPNITVDGFMTMAPFVADEKTLRATFARTREALFGCALTGRELSMGMSNDFEVAIEEGSTIVRLGTILFGERPQ